MVAAVGQTSSVVAAPAASRATQPLQPMPRALQEGDKLTLSSQGNLRQQLEPAFALIARTGHPDIAAKLRQAHLVLTDGKSFGTEYWAAAMPGGLVMIDRKALNQLTTAEWASVLLHEGVHLGQSAAVKLVSGWRSILTKQPDVTEREAYRIQWAAMPAMGIRDGIIYYTVQDNMRSLGMRADDTHPGA